MKTSKLSQRLSVDHTNSHDLPQESKPFSESAAVTSRRPNKRAAVLVCLFKASDGELRVILTRRASNLSSHSGEVSLPGGKRDEGDADDVQTALREAKEEIGLDPSFVRVVSVVEPFLNESGLIVVPVVGILTDRKAFNPAPNEDEVEAIFEDKNRREEERETVGHKYLFHFFYYEEENNSCVMWGLTAGILITVASIVYQRQPDFSVRKPKLWPAKL